MTWTKHFSMIIRSLNNKKYFINLSGLNKINFREIEEFYNRDLPYKIEEYVKRQRNIVNWSYSNPGSAYIDDIYKLYEENRNLVWDLDSDCSDSKMEFNSYIFLTNQRFIKHLINRDNIFCVMGDIETGLRKMEDKINNINRIPRGQKFIPIDPYGEEIWED